VCGASHWSRLCAQDIHHRTWIAQEKRALHTLEEKLAESEERFAQEWSETLAARKTKPSGGGGSVRRSDSERGTLGSVGLSMLQSSGQLPPKVLEVLRGGDGGGEGASARSGPATSSRSSSRTTSTALTPSSRSTLRSEGGSRRHVSHLRGLVRLRLQVCCDRVFACVCGRVSVLSLHLPLCRRLRPCLCACACACACRTVALSFSVMWRHARMRLVVVDTVVVALGAPLSRCCAGVCV
jgi:hypothetical protein